MVSVDRKIAKVAARQYGVFSRDQALAVGATPRVIQYRIETGRWERIFPGVYKLSGSPDSWQLSLMSACLAAPLAIASHRSAARVFAIPGFESESAIEVTVPDGHRRLRSLIVHESIDLTNGDTALKDGFRVTRPIRMLIDLAAVLPLDRLEEAVYSTVQRRLVRIPQLRARLRDPTCTGRRGIVALREIVEAHESGGAILHRSLEKPFLRILKDAGLPIPICQYQAKLTDREIAFIDFAYPDERIAIETDGFRFHSAPTKWGKDRKRRNWLTAHGWLLLHVTKEDIESGAQEICAQIAELLRLRRQSATSSVHEWRLDTI